MSNVLVTLTQPTTRADGSAFNAATDLKQVNLSVRPESGTQFVAVGAPMTPTQLTRTVANVSGGQWRYQAVWVDQNNQLSAPAEAVVTIPFSASNPGTITLSIV